MPNLRNAGIAMAAQLGVSTRTTAVRAIAIRPNGNLNDGRRLTNF